MNEFEKQVAKVTGNGLHSIEIKTIQVNLGAYCNQQCRHCHLQASPHRREKMQWSTMQLVLKAARIMDSELVDLTGGAPELNPHFRRFVEALCQEGHHVQVRTNLSALLLPGTEGMMEFLKSQQVRLVASLPCYLEKNVRSQRGPGVYEKSVEAIKWLNALGYGLDPALPLDLVYNPCGPFLPPEQSRLEAEYRQKLSELFGISFSRLRTMTNMPIGRFRAGLQGQRQAKQYQKMLQESFNPQTLEGLMCRHQLSVNWEGKLYDCDFNLALGYPVNHGAPDHLEQLEPFALARRRIFTGNHCFGCTAGRGSSCGGAVLELSNRVERNEQAKERC